MPTEAVSNARSILDSIPFEQRTLPYVLERAAREHGGKVFITDDARRLSYSQLWDSVARVANGIGRVCGENTRLGVFLPNRVEFALAWWGQLWRGGTAVLVHAAYKGELLSHVLNLADVTAIVVDAETLGALVAVRSELPKLQHVILVDGSVERAITWDNVASSEPSAPESVSPADPATVLFTSGTTGRSKAVLRSHAFDLTYAATTADAWRRVPDAHHVWTCLPCAHANTAFAVLYACLLLGGSVTLARRFSARSFWTEVAASGAQRVHLLSTMPNILIKQPPSDTDRAHGVKWVYSTPPPLDPEGFERRFGVRLVRGGYGSTEVFPIGPRPYEPQDWSLPKGWVGPVDAVFEARVVDRLGRALPARTIGELLIRPREPHRMMSEYYNDPAATVAAWSELWYHTRDLAFVDEGGAVNLAGRISDSIRRGGENVSAQELEAMAMQHEAVREAAAFGVPAELGEEEIKLDVVAADGRTLDVQDLAAYLRDRLPRFMVPRYIEVRDSLPKTPSQRVEKYRLKADGLARAMDLIRWQRA